MHAYGITKATIWVWENMGNGKQKKFEDLFDFCYLHMKILIPKTNGKLFKPDIQWPA